MRFVESPALGMFLEGVRAAEEGDLPGRKAIAARIGRVYESTMMDIANRVSRAMKPLSHAIAQSLFGDSR
jgi:hypothetical protein